MKDLHNAHNNDGEKRTSDKPGYVLPDNDTFRENLYRAKHSYQLYPSRQIEQEHGDEGSKPPMSQADDSICQDSCHTFHNSHAESPKHYQSPMPEILLDIPLPHPDFSWNQQYHYSQELLLSYKNRYSGIQIIPMHRGDYLIALSDYDLITVITLRQAVALCHTIAWVFKDSLPIPNTYVNIDTTEPL